MKTTRDDTSVYVSRMRFYIRLFCRVDAPMYEIAKSEQTVVNAVGFRRDRSVAYVRSRDRASRTRTVFFVRRVSSTRVCHSIPSRSLSLVFISYMRGRPPLSFISLSLTVSSFTCSSSRPGNLRPLVLWPDIHPLLFPLSRLVVTSSLDTSKPSPIDHKLRPIPTPSPASASTRQRSRFCGFRFYFHLFPMKSLKSIRHCRRHVRFITC